MRLWSETDASIEGKGPGSAVRFAVENAVKNINRQVASRATRAVNVLRNAELEVLKGQRNGTEYRKYPYRSTYTASAPGEPPARRTGNLRLRWSGGVESSPESSGGIRLTARLESEMDYAGYLENGTSKIEPRPFVKPIIDKAKPEIKKIYEEQYQ